MSYEIETASGSFYDYEFPVPEAIRIEDIARALSFVPRFAGHIRFFWSVAAHSMLVERITADWLCPADVRLAALLHDAHEAYIGDVPTPLKRVMGSTYEALREAADEAIADALGLDEALFDHPSVKSADALALRCEASVLKHSGGNDERWDRAWAPGLERPDPRYCPDDVSYPVQTEQRFLGAYVGLTRR